MLIFVLNIKKIVMKKIILSICIALFSFMGTSQVSFYVDPPSANSGNYSNTHADPSGGDWSCPDMTDPANAVTGELVIGRDSDVADSLGCLALINGTDVIGKIAVLYRGDCNFSTKAFMAQNAGAIAVVLINHTGEPVGMAGGTDGLNVTIPVVMISENAGAALHDEIEAGGLTCFIGNKFGYFADDLGLGQKDILRAKQFSSIQTFSQDATEFNVETGAWIFNFGTNDQTGITVTCNIDFGGTSIYNEISAAPISLVSGDSIFVSFNTFSQATYANGYYTMTYTIDYGVADEFPEDNAVNADFMMSDEIFTYSRVDSLTSKPISVSGYRSNTANNVFSNCIQFSDPNSSRMGAKGITFSASTASTGPATGLDGKLVEIGAYEWNDVVTDLNEATFSMSATNFITSGEFAYDGDFQDSMMFAMFDAPFQLIDNQNYLFCVTTYDVDVYFGFDTQLDYDENIDNTTSASSNNGLPTSVIQSDNGFAGLGFGTDLSGAIGVNLFPAIELGIEEMVTEEKIVAYPNPAVNMLTIPFNNNKEGNAVINIIDATGKVVSTQVNDLTGVNTLQLDVTNIAAGMYVFNISYENGANSTFNVLINK